MKTVGRSAVNGRRRAVSALAIRQARHAALVLVALMVSASAPAHAGVGTVAWRLETPPPPEADRSPTPIGLGRIGDIEFWAPNHGLLITAGNGSTIEPGVWTYNGKRWYELANVCGATNGRIAWAGPDEFWTISDGRTGQAVGPFGELPPLEDNSLCHFAHGEVIKSYATLAFQADSYLTMHAAACLSATDCWFGGEALSEPFPPGAFHLHWNGSAITAEPNRQGHPVWDMREFENRLYESVLWSSTDRFPEPNPEHEHGASVLHQIEPEAQAGVAGSPFVPIYEDEMPLGEPVTVLSYLHLSAGSEALWAAAGPRPGESGEITVLRYSSGVWSQVIGTETTPTGEPLPKGYLVTAIAAEPGTDEAWLALDTKQDLERPNPAAPALLAHLAANGTVSEVLSLPAAGEQRDGQPVGAKGAAANLACPAIHDCWMATTQGWLYHLAPEGETQLGEDADPNFTHLITVRPEDEGTPHVIGDSIPVDDSGLNETPPPAGNPAAETKAEERFARVAVPLLSAVHSRLVHGTTLALSFHLAVRARVRLLAKRARKVVASTPQQTLPAGNHTLKVLLNIHRWPTKLELQTHALAALPTRSTREAGTNVATTSLSFPNQLGLPRLPLEPFPEPGRPF